MPGPSQIMVGVVLDSMDTSGKNTLPDDAMAILPRRCDDPPHSKPAQPVEGKRVGKRPKDTVNIRISQPNMMGHQKPWFVETYLGPTLNLEPSGTYDKDGICMLSCL